MQTFKEAGMKKIYLFLLTGLLFATGSFAQVTVTNPTNTTPNLAATYTTLALAFTALNGITDISGAVTITLNAGNPQTAPIGGYTIQFTATTTAVNNITITGNNNVITAYTPQTPGSSNDAIFKIIGADYITLQNFTIQENPSNTTITPLGSNNMTDWGVALLYKSVTDGAQHNIIQNNTISLNKTYVFTFGIYSNTRHDAVTSGTIADITNNTTAPNSRNKVYGNTISNVNYPISFVGSGIAANQDVGNDIGGLSAATGNTFTNWGGLTGSGFYVSMSFNSDGIFVNNQTGENVSYNTISTTVSGTFIYLQGIAKDYSTAPVGTFTSVITNNTITITDSRLNGILQPIASNGIGTLSTATININNNNIINCVINGAAATVSFTGISNSFTPGTLNITNNIIRGITSTAILGGFTGILNTGTVVNTININNNKIGDAVSGAIIFSAANPFQIKGINNSGAAATATVNLNSNSMDGFSFVNTDEVAFIYISAATDVAVNINNNLLGSATGSLISFSGAQIRSLFGIYTQFTTTNCVINIQGNDIRGIVHAVAASSTHQYITSQTAAASVNISNNTFTNLNVNTSNSVRFITRLGNMTATGVSTVNNNSIVTAFNKSASGGSVTFFSSFSSSVNGSTMTETDNIFSNVTVTGSTTVYGIYDAEGASSSNGPTKTVTGNTFNNITAGSGNMLVIFLDNCATTICSSNTISNISGTGIINCILFGSNNNQGVFTCSSNTILNIAGSDVFGIDQSFNTIPTVNINNNNVSGLSSTNIFSIGIQAGAGGTVNIYDNVVNNLSNSSNTNIGIYGILVQGVTTASVYRNKIYNLSANGVLSGFSTYIYGMRFFTGNISVTAYNNFISDLKAPNISSTADVIQGISVISVTPLSTINLYYNSVYLNAGSTGTDFSTAGIYHTSNATATNGALNMVNNIIVNTSTANGTGVTAAYRRSGTTLNNYAATSDYNLFFSGTPAANKLIFYDGTNSDQTLAAYQTRVSIRDANSISVMPTFTSTTDLHLTIANCQLNGRGTPVGSVTTDIDAAARNATTPDIGADEFTATTSTNLAGVAGSAICETRTVSGAGTTYTSNACDLIAKVTPSGGAAVGGKINTCVTLDVAPLLFNGEPYVQRHHDIEPATSPATATGTISLYYTNVEFVSYNTLNPAWPKLPTVAGGANADPFRANLRVTQFHGTPTGGLPTTTPGNYTGTRVLITPGAANVVWNGSYWAVTFNVTGFSGFYLHTTLTNAPLPIIVNYLTGRKQGSNHLLNWKVTCATSPRATMALERSADGRNYMGINTITADAARCNQPFDYTDANLLKGMNYYRLKIVDADGKITYSTTVALLNAAKVFDIISIAPNPVVNGNFKLNVASALSGKMEIVIFDMQGRLVNRQSITLIAGFNSMPVNVTNLSAGTYTIRGSMAGEQTKIIRFVKQ